MLGSIRTGLLGWKTEWRHLSGLASLCSALFAQGKANVAGKNINSWTPCITAKQGQLFSAPMDWKHIQDQFDAMDVHEVPMLPVTGGLLQARVGVAISAGLVDLNKVLKQAIVRREIVVQLIQMKKMLGTPIIKKSTWSEQDGVLKILHRPMADLSRLAWSYIS